MDDNADWSKDPTILNITTKDFNLDFMSYEPSYHVDPQTAGEGAGVTVSMCPATEYWQHKMSSTGDSIVNEYNFNGVYFDQVAAVAPTPCYDRSHNHTMGGGNHW